MSYIKEIIDQWYAGCEFTVVNERDMQHLYLVVANCVITGATVDSDVLEEAKQIWNE